MDVSGAAISQLRVLYPLRDQGIGAPSRVAFLVRNPILPGHTGHIPPLWHNSERTLGLPWCSRFTDRRCDGTVRSR